MVFASLLFVFLFLAANILSQLLIRSVKGKNIAMLVFSLIFYSWSGPRYLILLVGMVFICWVGALVIQGMGREDRRRKTALAVTIALCLVILGIFKYTGFLVATFSGLFRADWPIPHIVLPIGISFYTFQLISYVVDVYRRQVRAQSSYWMLLLYASLFHQCIAGPIVRYETVAHEIEHRHASERDLYEGVRRFSIGLAKKCVLANACASVCDSVLPIGSPSLATQVMSGYWLGMLFYALQIYLDFSAYSDMAIGMGRMIGFHYLENFDHPYQCSSVQDFWRRWHISLSSFFRDYVYIPLGGSRCSDVEIIRNMAVVWFLTGMWHGASWNYILWGLYFLGFLLLERFVIKDRMPRLLGHVCALLVVYFGWVLFKFEDFGDLGSVLAGMVGGNGAGLTNLTIHTVFLQNIFLLAFSILACTGFGSWLRGRLSSAAGSNDLVLTIFGVLEMIMPPLLLLVSLISLAGASYNPFIYFQF